MAQLTAIVDKLLTEASSAFIPKGYVSEMLLPKIGVVQKSGLLGKYGQSHLRIESTLAGGRSKYRRAEPILRQTTQYLVESHGLEGLVTEDDYANVEKPFDAEKDETLGLSTIIWLDKEKSLADTLTSTSVITQNVTLSGAAQYSDYANSNPIDDFKTARLTVRDGCGMAPDTAVMDWGVANTLSYHPGILDALGFSQNRAGQLSDAELAKAMGVKKLLIAESMYNTAKEGQTDSLSQVWGKHIVFAVAPDSPQPYQTSLGYYLFMKNRKPRRVFKFNVDNPPGAKGILVDDHYDYLLSNVSCAYLIKDAIA